jgi:transcriptional regulator with XRE-family HTH domain
VGADPDPEVATNDEWREIMVAARKDLGMTQAQLATRIGAKQPQISEIESGDVVSSALILPICRVLKIAEPQHYVDEDQKLWSQLGHLLRNKSMKKYRRYLALLESEIEEEEGTEEHPVDGGRAQHPRK